MKKYLLSALAVLVMGLSANAQTVISNDYGSTTTDVSNNESNNTQENTSEKLVPRDYSSAGLTYSADLEYIDKGVYGIGGHFFGSKGFGVSYTMGWNFGDIMLLQYKIGPNYCTPISKNAYFYIPLYGAFNFLFADETEFGWGLDLVPSIGLKFGKFHIGAGLNLTWGEGADEIRTGLTANIAYSL